MSEYDFDVNNAGLDEVHAELNSNINRGVAIVGHLEPVLQQMFAAIESQAIPFWADMKVRWGLHYQAMMDDLGAGTTASQNAQLAIQHGDGQATRAML
jgi:hypothetical protein